MSPILFLPIVLSTRRQFATLDDLYAFLKTMSQEEYQGYLDRIECFLESEEAQLFSPEHFEKLFLDAIGADCLTMVRSDEILEVLGK
jgi:hypothetical protein